MLAPTHLLYLHGFRSSPASAKARETAARVRAYNARRAACGAAQVAWVCPQLPPSPREAIALARELLAGAERPALIGSSLGGFYATWLAAEFDARAALLNPAVDPARDLAARVGELTSWHEPSLRFEFTRQHVDELRALELGALGTPVPQAERYFVVMARDDEVLDWHEMFARYNGARVCLVDHGGHALVDFATRHLDPVLEFLGIDVGGLQPEGS